MGGFGLLYDGLQKLCKQNSREKLNEQS